MNNILTGNIWAQIRSRANSANRRLAAIAYVTTEDYVTFRKGDILVCDASDKSIGSGETSASLLARLLKKGVKLYSNPQLHSKLFLFGRYTLIGSNNLSMSSALHLDEAALLTTNTSVRSQSAALIYSLANKSQIIDSKFIARIIKISVKKAKFHNIRKRHSITLSQKTWIIRTYEINEDRYTSEQALVEKAEKALIRENVLSDPDNINWVRWTNHSSFAKNAREGDTIIIMHSELKSKRVQVYRPVAILKKQVHKQWTRFYYEDTEHEDHMSWSAFHRKISTIGIRSVKPTSTRALNPRDAAVIESIWEEH